MCTINGEESLNLITSVQSFENYQLDTASIEEGMYRLVCVWNASTSDIACSLQKLCISPFFFCKHIMFFI